MALYNSFGEHLSWCRFDPACDGYGVRTVILSGMRTGDDTERDCWPRRIDPTVLGFDPKPIKKRRERSLEDLIG